MHHSSVSTDRVVHRILPVIYLLFSLATSRAYGADFVLTSHRGNTGTGRFNAVRRKLKARLARAEK
jgi:hypothetical protein